MAISISGNGNIENVANISGNVVLPSTTSVGDVSSSALAQLGQYNLETEFSNISNQLGDRQRVSAGYFSATASGNQWCRCIYMSRRNPAKVTITTDGGYYTPGSVSFVIQRGWANDLHVGGTVKLGTQYVTKVRAAATTSSFEWYLEVLFNISSDPLGRQNAFLVMVQPLTSQSSNYQVSSYGTGLSSLGFISNEVTL